MIVLIAAGVALIVAIVVRIDPRLPVGLGLATLALSGIFIAIDMRDVANLLATITFFTLVFGTLLAFIELARWPPSTKGDLTSGVERHPLVEGDED